MVRVTVRVRVSRSVLLCWLLLLWHFRTGLTH